MDRITTATAGEKQEDSLELEINRTIELSRAFDMIAFGAKPEDAEKTPTPIGQVDRLRNNLREANIRLESALRQLSGLSVK